MKKTIFLTFMFSVLVVGGCFHKQNADNTLTNTGSTVQEVAISTEAQAQADKRMTGNETCDNYLATVKCIADKSQDPNNEFMKDYDSFLTSLDSIPVGQLQDTCTTLTTALQENPSVLIYNADCDMTRINTITSGNANMMNN